MLELPPSVSREDLVKEQASDPKLQELFTRVVSEEDLHSVSLSYFLNNSMLMWRWVR